LLNFVYINLGVQFIVFDLVDKQPALGNRIYYLLIMNPKTEYLKSSSAVHLKRSDMYPICYSSI